MQTTVSNSGFQAPVSGQYPYADSTYEPLKQEMDVLPRPQGVAVTSTVVNVGDNGTAPRDHIVWSLFNSIYMNFCCLGFLALVFSVKARDRKVAGDANGAKSYGSTAMGLNITTMVLTLLFYILLIILLATGVIVLANVIRGIAIIFENPNGNPYGGFGSG